MTQITLDSLLRLTIEVAGIELKSDLITVQELFEKLKIPEEDYYLFLYKTIEENQLEEILATRKENAALRISVDNKAISPQSLILGKCLHVLDKQC